MNVGRILREGFVAGLIGAAAVALWFLVVDIVARTPFFTPAMLGSALFWGETDPSVVVPGVPNVIGYTMTHIVLFTLAGAVAAGLAADRARERYCWRQPG